jgi:hypothetical protein
MRCTLADVIESFSGIKPIYLDSCKIESISMKFNLQINGSSMNVFDDIDINFDIKLTLIKSP